MSLIKWVTMLGSGFSFGLAIGLCGLSHSSLCDGGEGEGNRKGNRKGPAYSLRAKGMAWLRAKGMGRWGSTG